ncbi:MAG: cysteine hydrolase family protein [Ignavibacteriales bacterium]|nr:cysteine hydrolase family protein [Ignavibacteriales bacterium]
MKVLLIIDMQVGSFKPETPRYDADGVVERINSLSDYFRHNGDKVIFIQHDGTKENSYIPGTSDWNILPTLIQRPDDIILGKTANDSFYNTDLETILKKNDITDLFITGCATDFCVNATVHSALIKDYNIFVVKDCHTTANRSYLSAEKVIQYHNWLWENMTPTNGQIKLVLSKDLIKV